MPPKTRYTSEIILNTAYELLVEEGKEALVSRNIAKRLNATTQPIFSCFQSIDDLKKSLFIKAKKVFMDFVSDSMSYDPAFKQFGLLWIKFAQEKPHVYEFLFCTGTLYSSSETFIGEYPEFSEVMLAEICRYFEIQHDNAVMLLNEMIIFAHGLSSYLIRRPDCMSDDAICLVLSDMCIGAVNNIHLRNDTFRQDFAKSMAVYAAMKPVKVK